MAVVERFEDLRASQKARQLARDLHGYARLGSLAKDWALQDQMNRAASSIAANIAEGFERGSRAEFAQFLAIAKASCGELRSHLYLALDRGHIDTATHSQLLADAEDTARLIGALRTAVQRNSSRAKSAQEAKRGPPVT